MKVEKISKDNTSKIWIVRSGRDSAFYRNFKVNNLIAIGHIQEFDIQVPEGPISKESKEYILETYNSKLLSSENSSRQVSSKYGQVDRFINNIKTGDTVITVSSNAISVGIITSECYFNETSIEVLGDDKQDDCYFNLRYDVIWGKEQPRSTIPYSVELSLRNNGTVFSISDEEKIKYLSHWINPIHVYESEVRCSVNITLTTEISNRQLTKLSILLDKLEVLSNYIDDNFESEKIDFDGFVSYFNENELTFDYKLTAQHDFMSPGFQFLQLSGSQRKRMIFAILFSIIFSMSITEVEGNEVPDKLVLQANSILEQLDKKDKFTVTISDLHAKILENVAPKKPVVPKLDERLDNTSIEDPDFPESIESSESML
ncbi:hypothetical protein [Shewanella algae]|uniref:hypothetical protein n=1 Tax=Shewanella algae TaxID=38313 RepID=UPI0031F4813A